MDSICQGSQAYHGCDSLACRQTDLFKVHGREMRTSLARTSDVGAESDHLGLGDMRFETAHFVIRGAYDKHLLLLPL